MSAGQDQAGSTGTSDDTSAREVAQAGVAKHDTPDTEEKEAHGSAHHAPADGSDAHGGREDGVDPYEKDKEEAAEKESTHHDGPLGQVGELKDKLTDKKQKIKDKQHPPGGYDDTPLPDFPPGYTVRFTFRKADNLPFADIGTAAADPYLHATLTAPVPKRHKEDPVLTRRTRTLRRTTSPEWEEEWIVANIPAGGFHLKCRLYDEDYPDHDDRLGNVTVDINHMDENWEGFGPEGKWFDVKKRMGSKRAYFLKAITSSLDKNSTMTARLLLGAEVIGKSDGPGAQMYTVAPAIWIKHFSPMIGRLTGIKVNKDEEHDGREHHDSDDQQTKKYDFQANELQLSGPVPWKLYHRYVEFRPFVGLMFSSHGLRGKVLNKALHKQHRRIYNHDSSTQQGTFKACSKEASLQFLKLAHFDEGGRIFTYVLTLDGLMRFTETGKEFGIDLLSKHTMHSDVATYIACSGEFFIRRLAKPKASSDPEPDQPTHPSQELPGGPPMEPPPPEPEYYQLIIDNDSGTYRPDKSLLPLLQEFFERNFPGLGVVAMHWEDEELKKLKENQNKVKKSEGKMVNMVLNRSPSASSFSSSDESRLDDIEAEAVAEAQQRHKSKKETAFNMVEDPHRIKDLKIS